MMQPKYKRLLLNTKQPLGMWVIFFSTFCFSMGVTMVSINLNGYLDSLPQLEHASRWSGLDVNLYTNLFLYSGAGIIGGFIGYVIGHRRSVVLGTVFASVSLLILSLNNLTMIGFCAYVIAVGVVMPNLFTSLSFLYAQDDARRHAGFTLIYMASILGAALAISFSNTLIDNYGYKTIYVLMALMSFVAALCFVSDGTYLSRNIGLIDNVTPQYSPSSYSVIFILIILSSALSYLIEMPLLLKSLIMVIALFSISIMLLFSFKEQNTAQRKRNALLLVLLLLSGFFLFVGKNMLIVFLNYRGLFNSDYGFFTTKGFSSDFIFEVNIIAVMIVGVVSAALWNKNKQQQHVKRMMHLFALAILLMGVCCFLLFVSFYSQSFHYFAITGNYLLLITLALNSMAKILLLPLFYAMVGKLAPRRYESIVMGFFFAITAALGVLALTLANYTYHTTQNVLSTYHQLSIVFLIFIVLCVLLAIGSYLLLKLWLKRVKNV